MDSSPDENGIYATASNDGAGNVCMSHDVCGACLKHSLTRVAGAMSDYVGGPDYNDSYPLRGIWKDDMGRAFASTDNGNWVSHIL